LAVLRVSANSNPSATAGAIANGIRHQGLARIDVIGPRAVNQAVKAIAIARSYVAAGGIDLYCTPSFASIFVQDQGEEKTAIRFEIRSRHGMCGSAEGSDAVGMANT